MMPTKIRIQHVLLTLLGGMVILSGCRNSSPPSDDTIAVRTPVTVIPVTFKPVAASIDLPAISQFLNKNTVRATTTGIIDRILIRQGDLIASGQLLLSIRTREAMALDNLSSGDSSLLFRGLINIFSHEAGVINSIAYQKGDFVQEGDALAVISLQKSLVFILDVPFQYQYIADKNKECTIVLPDNTTIKGTITGKLPEMQMQSQTVSYIIRPHSVNKLPANLIAKVSLIISSNNNAIVLPKTAVLSNENQTEFWIMRVINDSTAIRVNIKKGFENNDEIEITEPSFTSSDRIVLKGNYGLADTAGISIARE
jgi:multidrug efflux pump subunit AcrA (membrane-fusion protein)